MALEVIIVIGGFWKTFPSGIFTKSSAFSLTWNQISNLLRIDLKDKWRFNKIWPLELYGKIFGAIPKMLDIMQFSKKLMVSINDSQGF